MQACKTWLGVKGHLQSSWKDDGLSEMPEHDAIPQAEPFVLTEQMYQGQSMENYFCTHEIHRRCYFSLYQGLKKCFWPGRNQIVQRNGVTYYLDGAHTPDSMQSCAEWFQTMTSLEERCPLLQHTLLL